MFPAKNPVIENSANGQKTITLSSDAPVDPGDHVLIEDCDITPIHQQPNQLQAQSMLMAAASAVNEAIFLLSDSDGKADINDELIEELQDAELLIRSKTGVINDSWSYEPGEFTDMSEEEVQSSYEEAIEEHSFSDEEIKEQVSAAIDRFADKMDDL